MTKRKFQAKASSMPKGLPLPKNKKARVNYNASINPFESARASSAKAPKFNVHNRPVSGRSSNNPLLNPIKGAGSALKRAIENRKLGLKQSLEKSKKAGTFIDRRIGESRKNEMTEEERILARIVRERSRRSKKMEKYSLEDDDGHTGGGSGGITNVSRGEDALQLTHRGKLIGDDYDGKLEPGDFMLSDDEDDRYGGQLEKADTELHFGGGAFDKDRARQALSNPYGPAGQEINESLSDRYRSRRQELEDLIMRKKYEKAEKAKHKEEQVEKFEELDENFKELARLLNFRDKEQDRKARLEAKKAGTLTQEEQEMDAWEQEMKGYLFERKVKATDRTKTPEEIAKEEADRLHELETRRLARMNGDFENDDFSDISDDDDGRKHGHKRAGRRKRNSHKNAKTDGRNPDELDSDDEVDDEDELQTKFTEDGLVYINKQGDVIKKVEEGDAFNNVHDNKRFDDDSEDSSEEEEDNGDEDSDNLGDSDEDASVDSGDGLSEGEESELEDTTLEVGTKVKGKYLADQQLEGKAKWYKGSITKVTQDKNGNTLYEILYDDGDIEENVRPENVRRQKIELEEAQAEESRHAQIANLSVKRQKAKQKARTEIPYVFEVPTTLEALHEMIATYATTGADASLIIERIHTSNSVRIDHRNKEKMQNFYDVLLRRFIGVGDALYQGGNGGEELGRYNQLDSLTKTLYNMAQDAPDSAAAVWGRRLGIFQNAHAKRLRDSEFVAIDDENEFSAWPSSGTLLLLRALGHIFPMTDLRHVVTTPALLLIGQILGQTPVRSTEDVIKGLFCTTLMLEYTKEAKRLVPEALSFLASTLCLFSDNLEESCFLSPLPTFRNVPKIHELRQMRKAVVGWNDDVDKSSENQGPHVCLSLEQSKMKASSSPLSILLSVLRLVEKSVQNYSGQLNSSEPEVFETIILSLLRLMPKSNASRFPPFVSAEMKRVAELVRYKIHIIIGEEQRRPLKRRTAAKAADIAIETLAPRMEDPNKYSMSKDKNKSRSQAEKDKLRREYKREHKAVSRELRLDAAFIESERRKEKDRKDTKARQLRRRNYAWMEQEQATMNQQVAQGGSLLKGGGTGAARMKAKSGKIGMKKGGK
eukprot:CAMPEP_0176498936 /NCGR_PEP_ID=MMETSP0200_2-20121128/12626_1 /TAXON_ID=947934 /ORGANISM="Chaetoceros sp., Strain GSL56" /LENGTH=1104 /DNA_ID=CAMNT_0017897255 /DNA_START=75 /DNA_END=3386 /DNA_ORIENTATION=-